MSATYTDDFDIGFDGPPGESQADLLRRTGMYGVLPTDTDEQAIGRLNSAFNNLLTNYLSRSGGFMLGNISFTGDRRITDLPAPTGNDQPARLQEIIDLDATLRGAIIQAIANLINAAPGSLDQLNELAAALGNDPNYATTILDKFATLIGNVPSGLNSLTKLAQAIGNDPSYAQNIATTIINLDNSLRGGDLLPELNSLRDVAAAVGSDPKFAETINAKIDNLILNAVQVGVPDAALVLPDELGQIIAAFFSDGVMLPGMTYNRPDTPDGHSISDGLYEDFAVRDGRAYFGGMEIKATSSGFYARTIDGSPLFAKDRSIAGSQFGNDLYITEAYDENGTPILPRSTITTPLFGAQIFMVSDRKLPIYARSISRFHDDGVLPVVSFDCARAAPLQSYCEVSQGTLRLESSLSGTGLLTLRNPGDRQSRGTKTVSVVSVTVPLASPKTVKVLALGDSISHRGLTQNADAFLKSWDITPTWLGTLPGLTVAGAATAPACEGREGWSTNDFLGISRDATIVSRGPLAAGQEPVYLAATDTVRNTYNPYLNSDINAGSQAPVVTIGSANYQFDLRYFLTRFSIADPDIVLLNLGMNDSNRLKGLPGGNIAALIAEIRRALPNAKIVLWGTAPAASRDGDTLWLVHRATLDSICATVRALRSAGDANVHLVSSWAHMSTETGFALSTNSSTDGAGNVTTVVSDPVHPIDTAAYQAHECVSAAVANLV